MAEIYVKLFNTPSLHKDNEKIFLPFRKAEALFYYLMVHKEATREVLVNLLWGEIEEETAKKNLRNAMYKIRKAFDLDIIISPQKSIVMLNPDIEIISDLKDFLEDSDKGIQAYTGDFLQGFSVKDGETFENWMFTTRESFKDMYIKKLYKKIRLLLEKKDYNTAEQYGKKLVAVDIFDERAYRTLMEIYTYQGANNKAIDTYNRLCEILDQELGVTPDNQTKDMFRNILANRDNSETNKPGTLEDFFYGRNKEVQLLENNYRNFLDKKAYNSILITGEAGIGKTRLKDHLLKSIDKEEVHLLETNCYQAEEEYFLKPWNSIFTRLSQILQKEKIEIPSMWNNIFASIFPSFVVENTTTSVNVIEELNHFKYRVVEDAVLGLLKKVADKKKIVIVFEDLQWIDTMSLSLLSSILTQEQGKNLLFIATCRDEFAEKIDTFITKVKKYQGIEEIHIPRFTPLEVADFIKKAIPSKNTKDTIINKIYKETEGNTFFIMEYLNSIKENNNFEKITPKMQDILKSRFLDISREGKKLLNIISLFFDKAPLDIIKILMDRDDLEVMEIVDEIRHKNIIKEIEEGHYISFEFTHLKLREFIYLQQSSAMRKVLHNKVGSILENELKNDKRNFKNYSKLIYHFSSGGNKIKSLKYSIKHINSYLDFSNEIFPSLSDSYIEREGDFHVAEKELTKYLQDIEKQLDEFKKHYTVSEEIRQLQMEFLHVKGRYCIREGEYDKGVACIQEMIKESLNIEKYDYTLKGYRQMINYCIQTHNIEEMTHYVEVGLKLAHRHNHQKEIGVLLRLKGLNKIMAGKYTEAEEFLKQSIKIFNEISKYESKYLLNIAAAYNYIGEIRRYNMRFSSALRYYDRAMAICEENRMIKGLMMFNTNAGQAALDMGDYDRAKTYFKRAMTFYRQLEIIWGRSVAEGYMSLLLVREGRYKEALSHLKRAEAYAKKLKSPYQLGLLYRVKAEIKVMMKNNDPLHKVFHAYINEDLETYCKKGIRLLEEVNHSYEREILKVFIKEQLN
ncbi:AAA family ATPase [Natronincola ferrireducens]|uniref:DNA-binding transcriptional activator of the SARP family n=1 Tax=Natronincola ferrireducens TaxID=393762 RepID=A0A1G9HDE9_9FIRM|nr:AAA family ATPase [Natronincola ferrireducens]SDL10929.1 DNA-binding transcriptional activator of the SARP family [Natronincola ferrireducens]